MGERNNTCELVQQRRKDCERRQLCVFVCLCVSRERGRWMQRRNVHEDAVASVGEGWDTTRAREDAENAIVMACAMEMTMGAMDRVGEL